MRFWYCVQNHKWLCAPPGSAFLYARREVQHVVEPLVVSWGWEPPLTPALSLGERERPARFVEENEWQGTRDPAAYLSVPAGIQFPAEHDWPRVRAECHELLPEASRQLVGAHGRAPLPRICPHSPEWYAQKAAFALPACGAAALQRRLYDECQVEVPILSWNGRQLVRCRCRGTGGKARMSRPWSEAWRHSHAVINPAICDSPLCLRGRESLAAAQTLHYRPLSLTNCSQ